MSEKKSREEIMQEMVEQLKKNPSAELMTEVAIPGVHVSMTEATSDPKQSK